MIKGRNEEALRNLARLHSRGNINDLFVQGEYQEMEAKVQEEATNEGGWSMVSHLPTRPRNGCADVDGRFSKTSIISERSFTVLCSSSLSR